MRFFNINGVLQKARRYVSGGSPVSPDDVKDAARLAEMLQDLQKRLTIAEARLPPEGVEFEVNVGTIGAQTVISHNLNSSVRWYVVAWAGTGTAGHSLVQDTTSDLQKLVLRSYVAGRAIVRVEPAFAGVTGT